MVEICIHPTYTKIMVEHKSVDDPFKETLYGFLLIPSNKNVIP